MKNSEEQSGVRAPGATLAPGTLLKERYYVESCVGHGASSTVYRAVDTHLASLPVAIKVFHQSFMRLPHFASMYSRELQSSYAVDHENVVRLYDMINSDGLIALVTEFIDGITLDEYVSQSGGRISEARTREVILAILRGLSAIHSRGLVHRDVKPQNVLISHDGAVKINDFGVAKSEGSDGDTQTQKTGRKAMAQLSGTPYYTAPEYMASGHYDARSDLHSAGIIAFELLTGRALFDTTSPAGFLISKVERPIPPIQSVLPGCHQALAAIIDRLLAKDPTNRPESAHEAINALEQIKVDSGAARLVTASHTTESSEAINLHRHQLNQAQQQFSAGRSRRGIIGFFSSGKVLYALTAAVVYYLVFHTRLVYWVQNLLL